MAPRHRTRTFFRSLANHSTRTTPRRAVKAWKSRHKKSNPRGTSLAQWGPVETLQPRTLYAKERKASARSGAERAAERLRRIANVRRLGASAGFTLIELMVVVVLVAILAMIAAPQMRVARDDRMAFDYARQIQQMIARARTRAAGRGGAHLIVAGPSGLRGKVQLWEALDNVPGPVPPGPNPATNCKTAGQWVGVMSYVPGVTAPTSLNRIVDGIELDTLGVNVDADIRATFRMSDVADPNALTATPALAICVTANGTVYAAEGSDIDNAILNMQGRSPFTGVAELKVTRNRAGTAVGLSRNVLVAGAGAPRIYSR
jgi:prepilin-type N-terminal cleavage/methylation domain-containing protein